MNTNQVLNELKVKFNKTDTTKAGDNRKPSLGISYPNLKVVADDISKMNYREFLETNDFSVYELEILQTYVIGKIKNFDEAIYYFKKFVPNTKEWSVVDSLCQKFVIAKKYQQQVFDYLKTLIKENDEYLQRVVAVMILSHFLNDEFIDESLSILCNLKHDGYYTKMAVAWAIATAMAKYPQKTIKIIKHSNLEKWVHNKTIQKIKESYRVNENDKKEIEYFKR
jgi:3-methyladenine DNA glycosylase AlkD